MMKLPKRTASNHLELELLSKGYKNIIGIDEVGRGAFAGPVVVGAFIFTQETHVIEGVYDSKKITRKKRELISEIFSTKEKIIKIGSVELIDKIGVGKTVEKLIQEVVREYSSPETYFLMDGYFSGLPHENSSQVVKGDSLHYSISCASILAKVFRDNLMQEIGSRYPFYNFQSNAGYGTAMHLEAIKKYGITPLHRLSFKPINDIANSAIKLS